MCMYMHCTKNCQEFKPSHRCLEYQYLVHSFTNTGFSSPNPLIRYYYKNNNSSKNNNLLVLNKKQSSQLTLFFNECIILQVKQITYWMLIFYSLRIKQLCSTYNFFSYKTKVWDTTSFLFTVNFKKMDFFPSSRFFYEGNKGTWVHWSKEHYMIII